MRVVLVGAVEGSAVALRTMIAAGTPPVAVITLPLAKSARHSDFVDLRPVADAAGVCVIETDQVNRPEILAMLGELSLDYLFVIGWSQLLSVPLLESARGGTVGYHPAPLPELRGRAAIPWTILQSRSTTASTLFWIDQGTDTGDILAQECLDVAPAETASTLYAKHMRALERLLADVLPQLAAGRGERRPQEHARATYCAKRTPADGLIDWSRAATEVWTLVRAVGDPYPGAFTFSKGRKLFVWSAEIVDRAPYIGIAGQVQHLGDGGALVMCGDGSYVRLGTVQFEGEPRRSAAECLKIHERLGIELESVLAARAPVRT